MDLICIGLLIFGVDVMCVVICCKEVIDVFVGFDGEVEMCLICIVVVDLCKDGVLLNDVIKV